jgi:RNA polymerase sigma-70 factor (ECF subfamily)
VTSAPEPRPFSNKPETQRPPGMPAAPLAGNTPLPSFTNTIDLVRQVQAGDDDARERLVARYLDRVLRAVRARMGPGLRRQYESGDIVQDAFVVALRKLDCFELRDEATFLSWMRAIVENQFREKAKGMKRRSAHGDKRRILTEEDFADADAPTPLARVADGEESGFVDDCVHQLGDPYRELILLRDYEGHAWTEIARRLELASPDAARMQHKTALAQLARVVRSGGKQPIEE